jgi:hypothetical protein
MTSSTSIVRVHSSPARHSVPPRSHSGRGSHVADTSVSEVGRRLDTFSQATTDTLESLATHNRTVVRVLAELDEKLRALSERIRRLEDLVGGNLVREGYN